MFPNYSGVSFLLDSWINSLSSPIDQSLEAFGKITASFPMACFAN